MSLNHISVNEKIRKYIQQVSYVEIEKIQNNTLLFKEGYFDSMGFISLISFIEEEFKMKTVDEDLVEENFESIDAITEFIVRKTK
jgi:acyl carrier protein